MVGDSLFHYLRFHIIEKLPVVYEIFISTTDCVKLKESRIHHFPVHTLPRFSFISNAKKFIHSFFIHSLNFKCLRGPGFLQSGALYATMTHDPRSDYNQQKSECS